MTAGSDTRSRIEAVGRAAFTDLFAAAPPEAVAAGGIEWRELGGAVCTLVAACPTVSMFGRALGLGVAAPAGETALDAICAYYRERRVDLYVSVPPGAEPAELAELLSGRGFEEAYGWMQFVRGVEPLEVETSLAVEPASDAGRGPFGEIVAAAFGLPPFAAEWTDALVERPGWSCFLAWDGPAPVAAGAMFVTDRTGYLGLGGVLPGHRGKRAQLALFAARIDAARDLGCDLLVTETGAREPGKPEYSYRNILRAGFEEAYLRPNYVLRAASA